VGNILYSICDAQPTDTVTATYSSKSALTVALTVARQDTAAGNPALSRQDCAATLRIEALNAQKCALGSR
jgi:hypothetical protein